MENLKQIYDYLAEKKCKDIAVYDVSKETEDYDYIFVVTCSSVVANKKFATAFAEELALTEMPEGFNKGEWIIFDLGEVLVHSFVPSAREKYNLDKLWKTKKTDIDK